MAADQPAAAPRARDPGRLTVYMWLAIAVIVAIVVSDLTRQQASYAARGSSCSGWRWCWCSRRRSARGGPRSRSSSEASTARGWMTTRSCSSRRTSPTARVPTRCSGRPSGQSAAAVRGLRLCAGRRRQAALRPTVEQLTRIMERIQDDGVSLVARGAVRSQALRDLVDKGITDVIVGPMEHRDQMVAFFTDLLGRPPEQVTASSGGAALARRADRPSAGVDLTTGPVRTEETANRPGGLRPTRPVRCDVCWSGARRPSAC